MILAVGVPTALVGVVGEGQAVQVVVILAVGVPTALAGTGFALAEGKSL